MFLVVFMIGGAIAEKYTSESLGDGGAFTGPRFLLSIPVAPGKSQGGRTVWNGREPWRNTGDAHPTGELTRRPRGTDTHPSG